MDISGLKDTNMEAFFIDHHNDSPIDDGIGFETELFPDFKKDCQFDRMPCIESTVRSPVLRKSYESRSEDAMSYDSDESSIIDVGVPEDVLHTKKSTEGDDELVSYLTGINASNSQTNKDGVKVVRVFAQKPNTELVLQPRVLKIDSSGNQRMLKTVTVLNHQFPQISKVEKNRETPDSTWPQDQRSLSKSALAARENREKKKIYIAELEKSVKNLSTSNKVLKEQHVSFSDTVNSLNREVLYLKSVLANQSTLSKLLQNIPGIPDISLSTSEANTTALRCKKRVHESTNSTDENENERTSEVVCNKLMRKDYSDFDKCSNSVSGVEGHVTAGNDTLGGVCLHVSGSAVSLEFCATCNQKAKTPAL